MGRRGRGRTGLSVAVRVRLGETPYYSISAHVVSAAPTGTIVEYIPEYDIAPMLEEPPKIEDGTIELPDRPGHGYKIDPDARAEHEVTFEGKS